MICALPFMMLVPVLPGMNPTAEEIMCRVAENQRRAQVARTAYVYDMNVCVRLQRANGELAREESREYVVAPTARGAERKLVKVEGKVREGKQEIPYSDPKYRTKHMDVDGSLTETFANEIMWKEKNNGPTVDWFPLVAERQKNSTFTLEGEERYRDFDVYKIAWQGHDEDDECWTGEALIEKNEFQPVLVTASWNCKIPRAVKIMLGINLTQLGVKITYQRFARDVWFPVSCGGELKLRVLFLYARTIAFRARNSDFRKADVQTSIEFEPATKQASPW
ncbi:MAG: hypothetical protein ABUS49_08610 [Acidobacteriota bacterium]